MKVLCPMLHLLTCEVISFGSCQDYRYTSKGRILHSTTEKMGSRLCCTEEGIFSLLSFTLGGEPS